MAMKKYMISVKWASIKPNGSKPFSTIQEIMQDTSAYIQLAQNPQIITGINQTNLTTRPHLELQYLTVINVWP